jgi:hypothetical protein
MPQAWITSTSYSSIAGGQAEPPITVRFRLEKRSCLLWTWLSSPSQTVGTPAA